MASGRLLSRPPGAAAGIAAILVTLAGCSGCIGPRHLLGRYHGTVVDGETGEPIEGAVVVAVWERCFVYELNPVEMNPCGHPYSVRETVTGPSGEFSMSARRDVDWNPLSYMAHSWARITIYAVDYVPLSTGERSVPGFEGSAAELESAMMQGRVIPLRRPDGPRELRKYAGLSVAGSVKLYEHADEIPQLHESVNRQRRKLRLQPIQTSGSR